MIIGTNLVDGHRFGSPDTLVPQQKPSLDNDLECFIIGERWPGCGFVDQSTDDVQNSGLSDSQKKGNLPWRPFIVIPGPMGGAQFVHLGVWPPLVHFDDRRDKNLFLATYAEPHLWTDQFHPFFRWQLISGEVCEA